MRTIRPKLPKENRRLLLMWGALLLVALFFVRICSPDVEASTPERDEVAAIPNLKISVAGADTLRCAARWLDYYGLDIMEAYFDRESDFYPWEPEEPESLYFREYGERARSKNDPEPYHSPDRSRYVDLGCWWHNPKTGEMETVWDDCQEIYFCDHDRRVLKMIMWLGSGSSMDGVFWYDNDTFILTGFDSDCHVMHLLDLATAKRRTYYINAKKGNSQPDMWGFIDDIGR